MLKTLPDILKAFSLVESWDDFVFWFEALPTFFQWVVVLGSIGVVAIVYIFIVAIFVDND